MHEQAIELARVEFGTFRKPEQVTDESSHVARVFQNKMNTILAPDQSPILYRMFGPSRHITRPGWQLLGAMYRVTAGTVDGSLKFVDYGGAEGFECTAEAIYVPTGKRISTAVGMCLTDEDNWDTRPEYKWNEDTKRREKTGEDLRVPLYQLGSMAQTRACSKVLSNLFAFVAIMAGCSGTSAEEMAASPMVNGAGETRGQAKTSGPGPQRTQNGSGVISEGQVGRLFGLIKQSGRTREALGVILAAHGYAAPVDDPDPVESAARLVKKGDFDKIQDAILKGPQ